MFVTSDAGDASLLTTDQCPHVTYPAPPTDASFGVGQSFTFAASKISFIPRTSSGFLGLDLDGVCTNLMYHPTYENGISSCVTKNDVTDQPGGVDNSLGSSLSLFNSALVPQGGSVDQLSNVNTRITNGEQTFLLVVRQWDGSPNASDLVVETYLSDRLESNLCDGGIDPDGGTIVDAGSGENGDDDGGDGGAPANESYFRPAPRFEGCDTWSVGQANFLPTTDGLDAQPVASTPHAWVVNDTLVAIYDKGVNLPFGLASIQTEDAYIEAKITRINGVITVQPGDGFIAGRVAPPNIFTAFASIIDPAALEDGGKHGLCPGSTSFASAFTTVCSAEDIAASPNEDFTNMPCDAISFGTSFGSSPAKIDPKPVDAGTPMPAPGCEGLPIASCN